VHDTIQRVTENDLMKRMLLAPLLLTILKFPVSAQNNMPSVCLESKSIGSNWNAFRDQSQELAKDLEKKCPEVRITTSKTDADYFITLNHIEAGIVLRENQVSVSDQTGTVLASGDKDSIKHGVKDACALILSDWSNQDHARDTLIKLINAAFEKEGADGYPEIVGDTLTVHSERATAMRFHMTLARPQMLSLFHRAGIATYIYTNDADQTFTHEFAKGAVMARPEQDTKTNPSTTKPNNNNQPASVTDGWWNKTNPTSDETQKSN
jgi:hypothetical protein